MPRISITEDAKNVLNNTVDQSDSYTYAKDALTDIAAAIDDIDMREHPEYDNPVDVLVNGAHADTEAGIQPVNYDPDADLDGWLDSDTVRVIASRPDSEINPAHVNSQSKPRDRVDKRRMIAAMVRYRHDKCHSQHIYDLIEQEFGDSEQMREYGEDVIQHHMWPDPYRDGDRWWIADPLKACAATRKMIKQCRDMINDRNGRPGGSGLSQLRETRQGVSQLVGVPHREAELTIEEWNEFVEEARAAEPTEKIEAVLMTFDA